MNAKALSFTFVSLFALVSSHPRALAADPNNAHASTEAADRQFLAALETTEPAPVAPVPTASAPMQEPVTHVAPSPVQVPVVKKEPSAKVATAAPKKPVTVVKRESTRSPQAAVEIRKAIPVTVTSTTTATTSYSGSVDQDEDDDHDQDHDNDDEHHDGFFHRLFRGEKMFR